MYQLKSKYQPTGDQPEAIRQLTEAFEKGVNYQTLLGVTGSGKTFTAANLIANLGQPTLVLSHNKTLAAQLYSELKSFFPNNAVEYFVSYYDYYQPEAYIAHSDTYIEKDMSINKEIEKMRLRTTASLLSGRKDVIVVSSVSCLYGMADPRVFSQQILSINLGDNFLLQDFTRSLVNIQYVNDKLTFESGYFRVKGDTVDVYPSIEGYDGVAYRITFWEDEVERIASFDPKTGREYCTLTNLVIHPANLFVTSKEQVNRAIAQIQTDLKEQVEALESEGKMYESKRLYERVTYDVEMIRELGYCSGIENYSRYFDGRQAGERPFCLFDYFPKDYLLVIDESHVTIPQIKAMYGGDKARKSSLVGYGFRLPSALDNRPLTFDEFSELSPKTLFISATPAEYELEKSEGVLVEQIIRPTGLLDPLIEVRPTEHQVDDLEEEIQKAIENEERVLVTTLTKRMAEELSEYLLKHQVSCAYIHSDVDTLDRVKIMDDLRAGIYDVLIGVNLLREGLDLPEVALVAILDADKEGFLRCHRSLTQTVGRAARNVNGRVIFYADKITDSMRQTMDETMRRRQIQMDYNEAHNLKPTPIVKEQKSIFAKEKSEAQVTEINSEDKAINLAKLSIDDLKQLADQTKERMYEAAEELDFIKAASLRDKFQTISKELEKRL